MGLLSLSLPTIGQPNSTEDSKVRDALSEIQTEFNGNIDLTNLSSAAYETVIPAVVTDLPLSPVNGQECFYLADDTNGIVWHLKYRAASASDYKWEFVGGHALRAFNAGQTFATAAELSAYTNIGTGSVTVPLEGDYHSAFGAQIGISGGTLGQSGYIGSAVGDTNPPVAAVHGEEQHTFVGGTSFAAVEASYRHDAVAALAVIKLRYVAGGSVTAPSSVSWANKWLEVTPIRVG